MEWQTMSNKLITSKGSDLKIDPFTKKDNGHTFALSVKPAPCVNKLYPIETNDVIKTTDQKWKEFYSKRYEEQKNSQNYLSWLSKNELPDSKLNFSKFDTKDLPKLIIKD